MLRIGWGSRDIVPDRPAMVQGQMHVRVARNALDPLTVTAMAIEGLRPDGAPDCAIIVSMDLAFTNEELHEGVRRRVSRRFPEVTPDKLFLTATHTHTSLVFMDGFYPHPGGDVMTPRECAEFLIERTAEAAIDAWASREPCRIGRAFGHALVAHNRRPVYADGTAIMYGKASREDFRCIEGPEDHSLDMLFVWDAEGALAGLVLDVPCPSQVDELLERWSADFWHEIRAELQARLGERLRVLAVCGAAGDQSPHLIFDSKQEAEMRRRRGFSERREIADRLADAVERALKSVERMEANAPVAHDVHRFTLPPRKITRRERDWHEAQHKLTIGKMDPDLWWPARLRSVVDIYDGRQTPDPWPVELHALRIGDAALVTNPFELYTDFGYRIKARSPAAQTFIAQIAAGVGWYLPTERAAESGGYGAIPAVSVVGPDGGQELVERSVAAIAALFAEAPVPVA